MNNNYFSTSDIGLAATLTTLGFKLEYFDRTNPQKIIFEFERTESLDKTIESYWTNNLLVDPVMLLANLKLIKNRLLA